MTWGERFRSFRKTGCSERCPATGAVVARWITDLRMIVTDAVAQRRLVDEVYGADGTELGGLRHSDGVLLETLALRPSEKADGRCVGRIHRPAVTKTYEVTWTEVTRDLVGQFVASHRYRAFVSVTTQEVTDARQALINPLGLYVTNLTWGEVVSTSGPSSAVANDQTTDGGSGK